MDIEIKHISKFFGENEVLKDVSMIIQSGKIHALMGENGAGKSTLMNILIGIHEKTTGTILIDNVEKVFSDGKEAEEFGISFIHQEMNNWNDMSVIENMFLNKEIKKSFGLLNEMRMREIANKHFEELGIEINLNEKISNLSVGEQQMVEIAKSLMTDCKVLIMDEPTAALSEREINKLFKIIRELRNKNVAIVYISHRMEEIFSLCDEITVMRDGFSIDTLPIAETNMNEVVKKMVGREITDYYPKKTAEIGEIIFEVKNLSAQDNRYREINFNVKAGEIVGFSGLMGAGRTEIMKGIFGVYPINSGEIYIDSEKMPKLTPPVAIEKGIGFLTEDRKSEGLILDFTINDNIVLPSIDGFVKKSIVDQKIEKEFSRMLMKRLLIKALSIEDTVGKLSGGNQQKVVLAKWIGAGPKILILDEPTRGVDVSAKREIYQLINELAERGVAIIVVSSDLPEVIGVSDRIIVIHEGRISGEILKEEATQEKIMTLATGGKL